MSTILSIPEQLGGVLLKWGVAKYIEAGGTETLARAQQVKAIAAELTGIAAGTITVAQLQAMASAELMTKGVSISNGILLQGLVSLISSVLPSNGGLLQAALAADVSVFLSDVTSVATSFGA